MKKLIICNTCYQLILAIQLKKTLQENDSTDILLTDHIKNVEDIGEELKKLQVFDNVFYTRIKKYDYNRSNILQLWDVISVNFIKEKYEIQPYDEIIFNGISMLIYKIDNYYRSINHCCKWSMMEEGILSYEQELCYGRRVELSRKIRKALKWPDLSNNLNSYYCTFPEIKQTINTKSVICIPSFKDNRKEIKEIVCNIFKMKQSPIGDIVYFCSAFDADGHVINESEIIHKLCKEVNRPIFVKKHPRYSEIMLPENVCIMEEPDRIPWEAYQIANDFKNKVLVTTISGSFISVTALLEDNTRGYFLTKEVDPKDDYTQKYIYRIKTVLDMLHSNNKCRNISICSVDEFGEIIKNDKAFT